VMVCTFGDMTDVTWWRDLRLETRPVIGKDGRMLPAPPAGITTREGTEAYEQLAGLPAKAARQLVTDLLHAAGAVRGEPEPIRHAVKYYEYGQVPLEIITTRQWYIRNGSRSKELANALMARGRELSWHPGHMRVRYEHWVEGLTGDWLISRQRYNGVPIPVWYPLDDTGRIGQDKPIMPAEADPFVFWVAPLMVVITAFTVFIVVPFGPTHAVTDMNIGVLFMLGVSSLSVLGIVMAGWASNSHYPLMGALRSSAQMVSYEIAMGLAVVSAVLMTSLNKEGTGTLSMIGIVQAQQAQQVWFVFKFFPLGLIAFVVFTTMRGELHQYLQATGV